MAAPDLVNLASLVDDAKCFALVRQHRWPEGVRCPGCGSDAVVRHGRDDTQPHPQHRLPTALDQAQDRWLVLLQRAAARRSCQSATPPKAPLFATEAGRPLCPATT